MVPDVRLERHTGDLYVALSRRAQSKTTEAQHQDDHPFRIPRGLRLPDRPVPLDVAFLAVENDGQHAAVPAGPPLTAPLDLVTPESVPPDEVVQSGGTGGGAHR
jgi:hypothetical protein